MQLYLIYISIALDNRQRDNIVFHSKIKKIKFLKCKKYVTFEYYIIYLYLYKSIFKNFDPCPIRYFIHYKNKSIK